MELKNYLFLDIETVPIKKDFKELSGNFKNLWDKKMSNIKKEDYLNIDDSWKNYAGIYSEFGKIICISTGYLQKNQLSNDYSFRIKSFYSDNEKDLLIEFKELLEKYFNKIKNFLVAHNGKEFDYPFIGRRMIINQIEIPEILNLQGKKPWEIRHYDTMEMWRFGDYKNFSSLELLSEILGIPSPKKNMNGSEVYNYFYGKNDLKSIVKYCQIDVLTTAKIFLKLKGLYSYEIKNIIES